MRTSLLGSTSTAPLVGVALAIFMVGLAVAAMPVTQTPLEVPRALGCTEDAVRGPDGSLHVHLSADMTVAVTQGDWRQVVPLVDLARTVRPRLVERLDPVVYFHPADELAWQDVVSAIDTLRGIDLDCKRALVALAHDAR
jgi:biopolymer transport protein ExbD